MQTITNSTPISPESPIQVDAEFEALIPPLKEEEFNGLSQGILKQGFDPLFPILVWNGTIIDGHNRFKICQAHNIPYLTATKEFASRQDVKRWILDNQLNRRNITPEQRLYLIGQQYLLEKKTVGAPVENKNAEKNNEVKNTTLIPKRSVEKIAKEHNIAEKSVQNAAKFAHSIDTIAVNMNIKPQELLNEKINITHKDIAILADLPKETQRAVIEKIRAKPLKEVKEVIKEIKKEDRNADLLQQQQAINEGKVQLPSGHYEIIAIDPPWPYDTQDRYDPETRRGATPYPEMSLEDIRAIKLPAAENCILFLWTTHKFMRYSFELLDTWGFRDVMIITWDKEKMGLGSWLRSQSEFCIMAVKGSPKVILTTQTTILHGKAREHSRKPEEFYDMVNNLCIGRKLDYFSRQQRPGWDSMGNEVNKFQGGIQS